MELKPGCKQTEVSVIPQDWAVLSMAKDATLKARIGWQGLTTAEYLPTGEYYLVTGTDFMNGRVDWASCWFVDASRYVQDRNIQLQVRDVLLTKDGTIGKVGFVDSLPGPATLNSGVFVIRPKADTFDPLFFFYVLTSRVFEEFLTQLRAGSTISHLYQKDFVDFSFRAPRLPEQTAIATMLSDMDALIGALDRLIAKKRDLKQAAMQQLLTGQTRLPEFSGEWELKRLGDVSAIKTGKKNNEDKVDDGAYPFFVRSQTVERIDSYSFDGEAILVPGEGGIGTIVHYINGRFDYHQRVYKISDFSDEVNGKFVFYCMSQLFYRQATRNSVKATVDSLRLPTFVGFEFLAPSAQEQTAIAAVLSDMDVEIATLEARRDKTRALKQGMMQELLTGRIRLV